jgi:hypothetical protein
MPTYATPRPLSQTQSCWRDGHWQVDELANLCEKLETLAAAQARIGELERLAGEVLSVGSATSREIHALGDGLRERDADLVLAEGWESLDAALDAALGRLAARLADNEAAVALVALEARPVVVADDAAGQVEDS